MSQRVRPLRVGIAVAVGICGFAMANAVDYGFTRGWPAWARGLWVFGILGGIIGGLLLFATSVGWLSERTLVARGNPNSRVPSVRVFVLVYVGMLALSLILSLGLERTLGVPANQTIFLYCGVLFLVASLGRPWWLYESIRRLGWFAAIERDGPMRGLLAVLGIAMAAGSFFLAK